MGNSDRTLTAPRQAVISITRSHLVLAAVGVVSVVMALLLLRLSDTFQLALLLVFPAAVVLIIILKNPYMGVFFYFLYSYLRPYDFIPALLPLRLAMVIEIVTLLSWILQILASKEQIKWHRFNWGLFGFLAVIGLTVVTAVNNHSAYVVFEGMLVIGIMFFISTNIVNSYGRLNKLIWLLLIIHTYFALRGIYNYFVLQNFNGVRTTSGAVASGFMADENDFALAMNVFLPFAFFLFQSSKTRIKRIVLASLMAIMVVSIVCSFSRGGLVGLVAVVIFCILRSKKKLVGIGVVIVLAVIMIGVTPSSYWNRMETITQTGEGTAQTRISYWKAAFRMYLDHPIVGVGAGNGGIYMPAYLTGTWNAWTEWGRAFHGTFPQIIAELGTAGLFFYLLMIYFIVRTMLLITRQKSTSDQDDFRGAMANSTIVSMVGYFASGAFLSAAYYPYIWTLYTFAIMLVFSWQSEGTASEDKNSVNAALRNRVPGLPQAGI